MVKGKYEERIRVDHLKFIKSVPITKEWPHANIAGLLRHAKPLQLTRNYVFYNIGDPVEYIYFIKQGEVEVIYYLIYIKINLLIRSLKRCFLILIKKILLRD